MLVEPVDSCLPPEEALAVDAQVSAGSLTQHLRHQVCLHKDERALQHCVADHHAEYEALQSTTRLDALQVFERKAADAAGKRRTPRAGCKELRPQVRTPTHSSAVTPHTTAGQASSPTSRHKWAARALFVSMPMHAAAEHRAGKERLPPAPASQ